MYVSEIDNHKPHPPPPPPLPQSIEFYKDHHHSHSHHPQPSLEDPDDDEADRDIMIDVVTAAAATTAANTTASTPDTNSLPSHQHHHQHQHHLQTAHHPTYRHHQILLNDNGSGGEEHESNSIGRNGGNGTTPSSSAPKKRAETWVQDETRSLISLRREMDLLFNTSKSNKHLWDQISAKMRERGFDRSPTMCTDKWRNLMKEFKKVKHQIGGNGPAKMSYYKEIDEILRERTKSSAVSSSAPPTAFKCGTSSVPAPSIAAKVDSFMQFSDKGMEDAPIPFVPIDANGRPTLNLERRLDHDGHPICIAAADTVTAGGGVPPSFWRETPGSGDESHPYGGRVVSIKWGNYTRRVGIDGTPDAIKEAIKSAFGIRTKRAFWLEDEDNVVRSFDRDMPLGNYTLHLDDGVSVKVCHYDDSDQIVHTEEKTFYTEEEFLNFLNRRGWSYLREYTAYRNIDNLDDLRPGGIYRGGT